MTQALQRDRDRDIESWRLRAGTRRAGSIEWVAGAPGGEVVHEREPGAGWALRFKLGLMSLFVDEELL